jgi:hypothetical protein
MGRHASGATTTGPPGSFGDRWGEFRVTVEPAHEIGAWRLRGGRTRFRRARTILDYITKAGHHSPGPIVEAVAVAGPRRPVVHPGSSMCASPRYKPSNRIFIRKTTRVAPGAPRLRWVRWKSARQHTTAQGTPCGLYWRKSGEKAAGLMNGGFMNRACRMSVPFNQAG